MGTGEKRIKNKELKMKNEEKGGKKTEVRNQKSVSCPEKSRQNKMLIVVIFSFFFASFFFLFVNMFITSFHAAYF
jgi:uncharacterized protein YqhQ